MKTNIIFFFFNDTATTEIYPLSLHDALPICIGERGQEQRRGQHADLGIAARQAVQNDAHDETGDGIARKDHADRRGREVDRSEEHTSELQSQSNLVCRLLLEKKKTIEEDMAC